MIENCRNYRNKKTPPVFFLISFSFSEPSPVDARNVWISSFKKFQSIHDPFIYGNLFESAILFQ